MKEALAGSEVGDVSTVAELEPSVGRLSPPPPPQADTRATVAMATPAILRSALRGRSRTAADAICAPPPLLASRRALEVFTLERASLGAGAPLGADHRGVLRERNETHARPSVVDTLRVLDRPRRQLAVVGLHDL